VSEPRDIRVHVELGKTDDEIPGAVSLAQDERSGVTGRLDLNAMRPRTAVPGARSRSSGAEVGLREGHA
jgi:hypothetical protein